MEVTLDKWQKGVSALIEGDDCGVWAFTRDGDYLTATWAGVQEYRFYVYNGDTSALQYDARTVIVGGHSLT